MSSGTTADDWIESFDREYREFVGRILDTVSAEFAKCSSSGCNGSHEAIIQLPDVASPGIATETLLFDICLYCPRPSRWQTTRCQLDKEAQVGYTPSKVLCELIKSSLRGREGLVLLFDQKSPAFSRIMNTRDRNFEDPNKYPMRSLTELMTKYQVFNPPYGDLEQGDPFKHPERRALAAKLALNLLNFCSWKHASRPWEGDGVFFLSSSQNDYNRVSPYIKCLLGRESSSTFTLAEPGNDAPIQCFTAFAKLLLEIEYGPLADGDFTPANDYGWFSIREFHENMQNYGDLSKRNYLEAVDACLQFHDLVRVARNTRSGRLETSDEVFRRLIRTKIVRNIVSDLPGFHQELSKRPRYDESESEASDYSSDTSDECGTPYISNSARHDFRGRLRKGQYTSQKGKDLRRNRNLAQPSLQGHYTQESEVTESEKSCLKLHHRLKTRKVGFRDVETNNSGSLFDAQSVHPHDEIIETAQAWLDTLEDKVWPLIKESRRPRDRAVKVAVLDTGIDITHPRIQDHLKLNSSKLAELRDWTSSSHGTADCVGHGTAVCDILLRVAKVQLFVGKVSDTVKFNNSTPECVAEAIRHAASGKGWDVDIIVLSLGFEHGDDLINQAITGAFSRNKIIFAAASNSSSVVPDKRVAYPARIRGHVLSIRSATGQNVRSSASPFPSDGDENFMILGEGIEAAWPSALNGGASTRHVSGTSFATPMAAGIACLILEFSIQRAGRSGNNVSKETADRLWTTGGIRKIFRHLSSVDDRSLNFDGRMICPWKLFNPDRKYEGYGIEIEAQMKAL
ncbi:subtilisin-like protein [Thozetella sp. PMI_491]|nr:subtilisin-like protein [Thozetella sp. PMI_491]